MANLRTGHTPERARGLGLTPDGEQDLAGCIRLWAAVLHNGVHDAWFGNGKDKAAALRWFEASDDGIGTFEWICQVLGLDPGCIRRRVGA